MNGLRAEDLLRLLEAGHTRSVLDKGLLLLAYACPEADVGALRALPLAERDRRLVALRRATFGDTMELTARCPECETQLETPLDLQLLSSLAAPVAPDDGIYEHDSLRFRLPSTHDLARALTASGDARHALVQGTLVDPDPSALEDHALDTATLEDLVPKLATAWEAVDPMAEVRFDFRCVECDCEFHRVFDIVDAFYDEIEAHGRRLLLDIHALASTYGWTESEVLALGPVRRRLYVDMVSG